MNKIERIKELVQILNSASDAYYNTDKPTISDQEFDKMFDELKQLQQETNYILSNSPTENVGFEIKSKLQKVEHSIPLKSLDKTKSIDEVKKFINNKDVLIMLKGDGLTCELIYDNGELQQASTRGNSIVGEDITHNAKTFKNIPLKISFKGYLKLAGEAVIFDKDFELVNSKLKEEDKYSNSRNLVAGSVRQLDSKICSKRNVNFMAFTLLQCEDKEFETLEEQFSFLMGLGFYIIPNFMIHKNEEIDLSKQINNLREYAKNKGIPIDGIVIKYNDIQYGLSLGETLHHPLNALALKFYDDEYETTYFTTEWNVSRTGLINPVGYFKPVEIDGASVKQATLHNIDYFQALQLGKNDVITVARQNQVIPKILSNKTRSNTEVIPKVCPICGSKTEIRLQKTARFLYCTNDNCPSKKVAQFSHFVSRNAMNIDGLSEKTIEKFINKGFLKDLSDIYKLEQYKNEIIHMEGFGIKSYNKLIESINKSKQCMLSAFLFALGIPQVGLNSAKLLEKHFKTIDDFLEALSKGYDLTCIEDFGETTNKAIHDWWIYMSTKNEKVIFELLEFISFKEEKKIETNNQVLLNKIFVITGDVHIYKNRKELQTKIEALGGKVTSSVSKNTSYLVNNDINSSSGKNKKAKELNIPIITEEDFEEMINVT